jgi:fatty acid desaturase
MQKNVQKNSYLIIETLGIFLLVSVLAVFLFQTNLSKLLKYLLYVPILLFQGLWFYRFYIVGHEASHRKLFAQNKRLNDFWGTVVLLPLMVPINIYRKIHLFHHGFNRKDNHTSVLDTFTTKKMSIFKKIYFYTLWYLAVFCGGFFIHSLISVLLFLFVPPKLAPKISPAFDGWNIQEQLKAIAFFTLGVGFHFAVYQGFGKMTYLLILGLPMLSFAWVLSLLVYIFHYDTTVGDEVRYNVRSVKRVPIISWILMNFNEHATHHQHPNIPWHELPEKRKPLPEQFANQNQNTDSFFKAIFNQFKGPRIINEQDQEN